MPILEVIKAGDVRVPDKVREIGDDESGWVIVVATVPRPNGRVSIEARYPEDDAVFEYGNYSVDMDLEAER